MSDRIEGEESPDLGISSAQSAILDMLSPSEEDTAEDSEERVDEFSEEGEVLDEAAEEYTDEELEADEEEIDLDDDEQEPDELETDDQTFTVKVNGEEVEVALDELKAGYSRQSDYTKKSQALSEERKTFEQDRDAVLLERQQYAQLLGALQQQLNGLDEPAPDFDKMYDEDPIEATRLERQWQQRQAAKQQKMQAIQLEQQRVEEANRQYQMQAMQQILAEEVQRLPDVIPEWKNEDVAAKEREELREYLINSGVAEEELQALVRANHIKVLRKAMLYDRGQKRVKRATKDGRRSKVVRPGSSQAQAKPSSRKQKSARQRLARSGRMDDAASLLESML